MSALPRLLLIADGFASEQADAVRDATAAAVEAGVRWVQLRDHAVPQGVFAPAAERFVSALRERAPDLGISINTHADVARELRTGLHVGSRGPSVTEARAQHLGGALSASVHTISEAERASAEGADAVLFSPIFPTTSKPGRGGAGLDALAACCAAVPGTVLALGGVTPDRVRDCLRAGAYGVAVLSGILRAPNPARATHRYLDQLPTA